MRYQDDFLLPLKLQKISCYFGLCHKVLLANQFAGLFTFTLSLEKSLVYWGTLIEVNRSILFSYKHCFFSFLVWNINKLLKIISGAAKWFGLTALCNGVDCKKLPWKKVQSLGQSIIPEAGLSLTIIIEKCIFPFLREWDSHCNTQIIKITRKYILSYGDKWFLRCVVIFQIFRSLAVANTFSSQVPSV